MTSPFPEIPDELVPQIGHALKGWSHLTSVAARKLPSDLQRANRVRRGALQFLNVPKKPRH